MYIKKHGRGEKLTERPPIPSSAEVGIRLRSSHQGQVVAQRSGRTSQSEHLTLASFFPGVDVLEVLLWSKMLTPLLCVLDHTKAGGLRRARRHMIEKEAQRYLNGGGWRVRIVK
jgi:hypothetical protein